MTIWRPAAGVAPPVPATVAVVATFRPAKSTLPSPVCDTVRPAATAEAATVK
jgi:hypothetical protein